MRDDGRVQDVAAGVVQPSGVRRRDTTRGSIDCPLQLGAHLRIEPPARGEDEEVFAVRAVAKVPFQDRRCTVRVSSGYTKAVREKLRLHPGQRLQVLEGKGVITLVPEVPLKSLKGFVKGVDKAGLREKKDRM